MEHKQSQNERILRYLRKGKKLTQLQAYSMFECTRLPSRIFDLRKEYLAPGEILHSKLIKTKTGKHISQYSIEVKKKKAA